MISSVSVFAFCFWAAILVFATIVFQYLFSIRGNLFQLQNAQHLKANLDNDIASIKSLTINLGSAPGRISNMVSSGNINNCNSQIGSIKVDRGSKITNAGSLMDIGFLDKNGLPLPRQDILLNRIVRITGDGWCYAAMLSGNKWRLVYEKGTCKDETRILGQEIEMLRCYTSPLNFLFMHPLTRVFLLIAVFILLMIVLFYTVSWK